VGVGERHHGLAALLSGNSPSAHFTGGWVGPQHRSGRVKRISPPTVYDPRTVQPVASRYTDWAILAPLVIIPCCLSAISVLARDTRIRFSEEVPLPHSTQIGSRAQIPTQQVLAGA